MRTSVTGLSPSSGTQQSGPGPAPFAPHRVFRGASQLVSIAGWAPPAIRPTSEFDERLSPFLPGMKIEEKMGVRQRHVAEDADDLVGTAMEAVNRAIAKAGIQADEIDLVIFGGVSRQYVEPATAAVINARLGLKDAIAFDVTNACLGFMDAWFVADAMIGAGRARTALIVTAEHVENQQRLSLEAIERGEDPRSLAATLSLGDGAVAAILRPKAPEPEAAGIQFGLRETFGEFWDLCVVPTVEKPMRTQSVKLMNVALERLGPSVRKVLAETGWSVEDVDLLVPHQASVKIIVDGINGLGIPLERTMVTVDQYGNMVSAALPFALALAIEQGRVGPGSRIVLTGYGSGLGIGMATLKL